jgi:1-acyl-sn-glycerol-3-phosphate acyltransferase
VFPEGTTSDGRGLLPFHANLLQAAVSSGVQVQPVALRFSDRLHRVSPSAEFIGDTTLTQSLWRLASGDGLAVHVTLLPARPAGSDRRALAEALQEDIRGALEA